MSKSSRLGTKLELEVKAILEKWGHKVYRAKKVRFGSQDVFGCDLVAKRPDCAWRFVQVSTQSQRSHKKRQVEAGMKGAYGAGEFGNITSPETWIWGHWPQGEGFQVSSYTGKRNNPWVKDFWVSTDGENMVILS